jgi:hypothetical protein
MSFNATRLGLVATAALVGCLSFAGEAQAGKITFGFNCVISNATTCNSAGQFGTLTLTDSLVDANRIDIDVVLNAGNIQAENAFATGLNNFFLNYGGPRDARTSFKLVRQSDPSGTFGTTSSEVEINLNNMGPLGTTLDIALNPVVGGPPSWTYSGSLVLRLDANPHTELDLDVSMFYLKDANDLLYAGFDTTPTNHKFFGGSTVIASEGVTSTTPVPESGTLVLVGLGLLATARLARSRTLKK